MKTRGNLILWYLRRRSASLAYKLAIPSVLGTLLLLIIGASVAFAFTQVEEQAALLMAENARAGDATRLQIETRSLMDTAQSALNSSDPETLARLYQQRGRLRAAIDAARQRDPDSLGTREKGDLETVEEAIGPLDSMASLLQRGFPDTAQGSWDREVYDDMINAVTAANDFQKLSAAAARGTAQSTLNAITLAAVASAVVLLLALLVLPLLGWLNNRLVVTPIQAVTEAMSRVADGDLDARVVLDHNDELGRLEESFNDMTTALNILLESTGDRQALAVAGGTTTLLRSAKAAAGRATRTADELEQAYRIQSALLPPTGALVPGWTVEAARVPATELGGDFYDLLVLPDGKLGLVIGDVSGHGAASALIAAWTQGMLALAAADETDPGEVLGRVNSLLHARLPKRMFVTLAYAVLDPERGRIDYANAGHCYPLIHQIAKPAGNGNGNGVVAEGWQWVEVPGLPLGSVPGARYTTRSYDLSGVDGFLLYSDGIVEARDPHGEFFGFDGLQTVAGRLLPNGMTGEDGVAERLLYTALNYAETARPEDDMTVLLVQRQGDKAAHPHVETTDTRYLATAESHATT